MIQLDYKNCIARLNNFCEKEMYFRYLAGRHVNIRRIFFKVTKYSKSCFGNLIFFGVLLNCGLQTAEPAEPLFFFFFFFFFFKKNIKKKIKIKHQ